MSSTHDSARPKAKYARTSPTEVKRPIRRSAVYPSGPTRWSPWRSPCCAVLKGLSTGEQLLLARSPEKEMG